MNIQQPHAAASASTSCPRSLRLALSSTFEIKYKPERGTLDNKALNRSRVFRCANIVSRMIG
ncbi:hypothetical protein MFFC18_18120 [Mariniblastus fucicola]|uniref:Uncharacterized protein n=1 Tax=Mariniblastus fucicola TaxID=980251 RepID=A0A5B9PGD7_9BACT|nr:hypothetical protein MFFC18_18120 [Mariniblastus fucicola]